MAEDVVRGTAPRAWLDEVNTWQQLQINSSESRINFKIKDLPKYVDEAKRYGVNAIQLTGWSYGGAGPRPAPTSRSTRVWVRPKSSER